jgi:DNA-binding NtrC family response regulator
MYDECRKSIDQIEDYIKKQQFEEAYSEVKRIQDHICKVDLFDPEQEKLYERFLQARIVSRVLFGKNDEIIQAHIRQEKYPSASKHKVDGKHVITLSMNNFILTSHDAYVSSVNVNQPFEGVHDRSSTMNYIRKLGIEEIQGQLEDQKSLVGNKGKFLILIHPELKAPKSYHIMIYDDQPVDLEKLKEGVKRVLKDATKLGIKSLGFIPIAFDYVIKAKPEDRDKLAQELANCTVETIVNYFLDNKAKQIPHIYFDFVRVDSMLAFDRAFNYWCSVSKKERYIRQQFNEFEQRIISEAQTTNHEYKKRLKRIAYSIQSDTKILILGESGVGKTKFASVIHENSRFTKNKFVELNCAQLRRESLDIQLFGWVKGSFTDAKADGVGAIEEADGGTLFLDEIGRMEIEVQKKLLKFLDKGYYTRYGESKPRQANVRLIFGTNLDLEYLVKLELFLPDFYERIVQQVLTIPPLRERKEDIIILANSFIEKLNDYHHVKLSITDPAMAQFQKYDWPGNVRQFKNYLENLYNLAKWEQKSTIVEEMIIENPPRNYSFYEVNPLEHLEKTILDLLRTWNCDNGDFLEGLIMPVVAKVYLKDLNGNRKNASQMVGMDGTRGSVSEVAKKLEKYSNIHNLIK